jgi:hypothetical protein
MQRQRLTITLETELLDAIDTLVDGELLRNRSHAIEHFLKEGIGLHDLRQAFLFFPSETLFSQDQLETVITACFNDAVPDLFIGTPSASGSRAAEVSAIIAQVAKRLGNETFFTLRRVPLDFGSGAAVLLHKELLEGPFVICTFDGQLASPTSFLQPYLFHKKHGSPLTLCMTQNDDLSFQASGVAIAQPEIVAAIPAGMSSLEKNIFPQLLKEGKVRGYTIL